MSVQAPGERYDTAATKAVRHKRPCVEHGHPGIALKNGQPEPMAVNVANAAAAELIEVGDGVTIAMTGLWPIEKSLLPAGASLGEPLWIDPVDNSLEAAAAAGLVKFGLVDEDVDYDDDLIFVNLNLRDTF